MTEKELLTLAVKFTEALIHNRPQDVPTAPNCKCTYEGPKVELGKGDVWGIPRRIPYRQTFVDPLTNTVCFSGVITNNVGLKIMKVEDPKWLHGPQKWWIYYARLTANSEGKLIEIEEVARPETGSALWVLPHQMTPPRIMETPLPEKAKSTREEMIKIVSLYWDGVQKIVDSKIVPIHPDARRFEVGTPVTDEMFHPESVRTAYDNAEFKWDCIKRRYPVVDVDTGICISTTHMVNCPPSEPPGYVTDIFKIEYGLIKYIYAFHDWHIDYIDWEGVGPQTAAECK
ncbi:hypothetical protein LQZ21_11455 [Treponema sp. TIM-1]|uniref:hypothetical protein n=1 Tax=Treponema sp. TIM-1 TaxID=2898417 RepID=UPI00397EF2CF